eukprot:CAMPEP_0206495340 /NCGR_PEP_ID=MMETSP0324_2-20121206/48438_1 /ASSEMBLY_ACC=CAM_ASM_000836 /TAXON_ID=2866 /ORGANISM="Crypthecodinium cohnii, Strain Seligo" /LENGTH=50 /DNA_ID=CAMNT_0053979513 /DNA_START=17 /DNA_END=165 /DNA_ORIENTATION=-
MPMIYGNKDHGQVSKQESKRKTRKTKEKTYRRPGQAKAHQHACEGGSREP